MVINWIILFRLFVPPVDWTRDRRIPQLCVYPTSSLDRRFQWRPIERNVLVPRTSNDDVTTEDGWRHGCGAALAIEINLFICCRRDAYDDYSVTVSARWQRWQHALAVTWQPGYHRPCQDANTISTRRRKILVLPPPVAVRPSLRRNLRHWNFYWTRQDTGAVFFSFVSKYNWNKTLGNC